MAGAVTDSVVETGTAVHRRGIGVIGGRWGAATIGGGGELQVAPFNLGPGEDKARAEVSGKQVGGAILQDALGRVRQGDNGDGYQVIGSWVAGGDVAVGIGEAEVRQ